MKEVKDTHVIGPHLIEAVYSLRPQLPADGDRATARAEILLPSTDRESLIEDLRFGNRLIFFGEFLRYDWGQQRTPYFRARQTGVFEGPTYARALEVARQQVTAEIGRLRKLYESRQLAIAQLDGPTVEDCLDLLDEIRANLRDRIEPLPQIEDLHAALQEIRRAL